MTAGPPTMALTLKTFANHLTSEGFSMFPGVYWAKVSKPAADRCVPSFRAHFLLDDESLRYTSANLRGLPVHEWPKHGRIIGPHVTRIRSNTSPTLVQYLRSGARVSNPFPTRSRYYPGLNALFFYIFLYFFIFIFIFFPR